MRNISSMMIYIKESSNLTRKAVNNIVSASSSSLVRGCGDLRCSDTSFRSPIRTSQSRAIKGSRVDRGNHNKALSRINLADERPSREQNIAF